jgi:cell shape-determining protein MreD
MELSMESQHEPVEVQQGPNVAARTNNKHGVTGFVLGVIGYFLYEVGLLPILAIVFSSIGLGTHDPSQHKNRWMSIVGLISGIIGTFLYLYAYGHIG